ncbi:MAG: MBL fold metallo-hydrolase [Spirochaetota bacterium]
MAIKITTLVENTLGEHLALKNEHGLSFYIEKDSHKVLFDTGQSAAFMYNAEQLRIDLSDLEYVILSHGHYDHSGGLVNLVDKYRQYEVIIGTGFFNEKYGFSGNSYEYLGNRFEETFLMEKGIPYRFVSEDLTEILPGIYVITNFPRIHPDELISPRFKVRKDGEFVHDLFDDEVLIAIDTPEGIVVLLGCSHPGVRNMLDHVKALLEKPIYAVVGGTHLVEASSVSMDKASEYLTGADMGLIGVSHCTGKTAMARLGASNDKYFQNSTGTTLIV